MCKPLLYSPTDKAMLCAGSVDFGYIDAKQQERNTQISSCRAEIFGSAVVGYMLLKLSTQALDMHAEGLRPPTLSALLSQRVNLPALPRLLPFHLASLPFVPCQVYTGLQLQI